MIALEAADAISALDLVERLRGYGARSAALGGDLHEVVAENVGTEQLRDVLAVVAEWGRAYGLDSVGIRVGSRAYELQLRRSELNWREIT